MFFAAAKRFENSLDAVMEKETSTGWQACGAAYVAVYGFSLSGLPGYTRLFGQVFTPAVTLIFVLKTIFFSLAVSLIPMASALYGMRGASVRTSAEMRGLVRMFAVILLIEVASLVGNYY